MSEGSPIFSGIATGRWSAGQGREMWREAARYEPAMVEDERESLLAEWRGLNASLDNIVGPRER